MSSSDLPLFIGPTMTVRSLSPFVVGIRRVGRLVGRAARPGSDCCETPMDTRRHPAIPSDIGSADSPGLCGGSRCYGSRTRPYPVFLRHAADPAVPGRVRGGGL